MTTACVEEDKDRAAPHRTFPCSLAVVAPSLSRPASELILKDGSRLWVFTLLVHFLPKGIIALQMELQDRKHHILSSTYITIILFIYSYYYYYYYYYLLLLLLLSYIYSGSNIISPEDLSLG